MAARRTPRAHLAAGDHAGFAAQVDRSYDLRASMVELDQRHVRMIEVARGCRAAANFAGSGGAIAGTLPSPGALDGLRRALTAEGCVVIAPRLALKPADLRPN